MVRAKRRVEQSGGDVERIASEIAERDERDSSRSDSPLMKTSDSVTIDTSDISVDEVVDQIEQLLAKKRDDQKASQ